jgi:threonine synthase
LIEFGYVCSECGREYEIAPEVMVCGHCAREQQRDHPLRGVLEVSLVGSLDGEWDALDLLPVERHFFPSMPVGGTPLWAPQNLRDQLGYRNLFIKDDTLNPTGSLKDRASFLVAAFARKHGIRNVVVASTGNAGSSMAGVGAAAGLQVTLFVPKTAPKAKMVQALQFGAKLVPVDGNYDRAYELSLEYARVKGYLSRNTAYNPLTIEGKKTAALEIYRQLGRAPDYVFVPVGDGVILAGVYKGFQDLLRLGLIGRMPTVYAAQAEGSNGIAQAFHRGDFDPAYSARTIADSISVDVPRNGYHAVKLLRNHGGRCVSVRDEAILGAQRCLASSTGLFAEPSAAAALAGFLASMEQIPRDATVVLLVTGSGLKDIDSAMRVVTLPERAVSRVAEIE